MTPNKIAKNLNSEVLLSHSICRTLAVLIVPFVEYLVIRLVLRNYLEIKIGWSGVLTDFDLILPVPIAFLLFMEFLQHEKPLVLKVIPKFLSINLGLFTLFLFGQFYFSKLQNLLGNFFYPMWWVCLATVFVSGFFVLVPPTYYFRNKNRLLAIPCALLSVSALTYHAFLEPAWRSFVSPMASLLCKGLGFITGPSLICRAVSGGGKDYIGLDLSGFKVLIGQGCGGMDAFLMFTFCFLIFYLVHRQSLRLLGWGAIFSSGVLLMTGLNILRITILFFLGVFLKTYYPTETALLFYKSVVHAHFGWVLYLAGIAVYLKWSVRFFKSAANLTEASSYANKPALRAE